MGDSISRQAAIDILYDFAGCIVDTPNRYYHKVYKAHQHRLESLPSAQQEIIHCKDCKYWNTHNAECEGIGHWFGLEGVWSENGYCYKAERRE